MGNGTAVTQWDLDRFRRTSPSPSTRPRQKNRARVEQWRSGAGIVEIGSRGSLSFDLGLDLAIARRLLQNPTC